MIKYRTFFLSLVCQHGTESDVTDALDVFLAGGELIINDDAALVVDFNSGSFEIETLGVWSATNSDKNDIGFELRKLSGHV